jgi:hypothetical protein
MIFFFLKKKKESKDCPNLKVIRLFGLEAHDEGLDEPYCEYQYVDHPRRSVDVPGQIRAAFPDAQVSTTSVAG